MREYQFKPSQWTMGKNFDASGSCGPAVVTADALLPGARGLAIETRIDGTVMQSASTCEMVTDVASLVSIVSEVMTSSPATLSSPARPPASAGRGRRGGC